MPLHPTSQLLVDTLEGLPSLEGRYANLKVVNWSTTSGKRGFFSLVFRADDTVEGRPVALKFFDPAQLMDQYRLAAFQRECSILQGLMNVDRCLQLEKGIAAYNLTVPGSAGIVIPCQYFAVQWIESDVDDYFLGKTDDAVDKLKLFNEMVLSVEALHRHGVFHRDLKADNLRAIVDASGRRVVVAIDLGTAARFDSKYVLPSYGGQVGAWPYSSPEARCGLAGNRLVAASTDLYALGCLLFELFNPDYFFRALYAANPNYDTRLSAMASVVTDHSTEHKEVNQWRRAIEQFAGGVTAVPICGAGSSVPPGISQLLDEVLGRLTSFDYLNRPVLQWVRQRIWIAIRVLMNQEIYSARLQKSKELRARRLEKAAAKAKGKAGGKFLC